MGRWSRLIAPLLADFTTVPDGSKCSMLASRACVGGARQVIGVTWPFGDSYKCAITAIIGSDPADQKDSF
jgi:hypothetical protein